MWYKIAIENDLETQVKQKLISLKPKIASAAQVEYDKWDEDDIDTYAGGGICNYIAPVIAEIVGSAFPEFICITASVENPNHEFARLILASEAEFEDQSNDESVTVFDIDIPYYIYETCINDYCWKKEPDVQFTSEDIVIEKWTYSLQDLRY